MECRAAWLQAFIEYTSSFLSLAEQKRLYL